jgi:hypothetical protein
MGYDFPSPMLTLRKEQLRALALGDTLVREGSAHLRTHLRARVAGWSDADLREHVRRALRSGSSYGLTGRRDLLRFLTLSVFAGRRWWRRPETAWLHDAMRNLDLGTPRDRLDHTFERYVRELEDREGDTS